MMNDDGSVANVEITDNSAAVCSMESKVFFARSLSGRRSDRMCRVVMIVKLMVFLLR